MGSIVPLAHNTYSLGTPTNVWKDVYIGSFPLHGQKALKVIQIRLSWVQMTIKI